MKRCALLCSYAAFLLFTGPLLLYGCFERKPYIYDDIQAEYADYICTISPAESNPNSITTTAPEQGTAADSCDLTRPVSLTDAIGVALTNNPDNKIAAARLARATAAIEQSHAAFYPYLHVYGEYMTGDAPSAYLFKKIDQRDLPAGVDFNHPGQFHNFESGLHAGVNVYRGGADTLKRRIAETAREITAIDRNGVKNAITAAVIEHYFNSLAAKEMIAIATESVATVEEQLRVTQVQFVAGGVLKSDLLSLQVRLAEAREQELRSRNHTQTAQAALAGILGLSPHRPLQLIKAEFRLPEMLRELDNGALFALDNHPALKKVRQQVVQGRMALDLMRSGHRPQVDFEARYYMDGEDSQYSLADDNWTAAVMLNWNLFDGYATRAARRQSQADLIALLAADRKTLLAVELDVKTAYLGTAEAGARLEVARRAVVSARESLNLVNLQYEGGSATITRYLQAELDRNQARTRETTAYYDLQKAWANVGRSIGYWARGDSARQANGIRRGKENIQP